MALISIRKGRKFLMEQTFIQGFEVGEELSLFKEKQGDPQV